MVTFEYAMLKSDSNYIPVKYLVMHPDVGSSLANSNVWLKCVSHGIDTEVNLEIHLSSLEKVWRNHAFANEAAFTAAKAAGFFFVQKEVVQLATVVTVPPSQYGTVEVPSAGRQILVLQTGPGIVEGTDWEYMDTFNPSSSILGTIGEYSVQKLSDIQTYNAPRSIMNGPFIIG